MAVTEAREALPADGCDLQLAVDYRPPFASGSDSQRAFASGSDSRQAAGKQRQQNGCTLPKVNYQKELEAILAKHTRAGEVPTLLLHSCCGPCSSYVLEYLSDYFSITVLYYNPNIDPLEEYEKRVREQEALIRRLPARHPIQFLAGTYEPQQFYETVKGMEDQAEGKERCFACYALRLKEAARCAADHGMDYFTTTLSISPQKNAAKLNEIGLALEKEYPVRYLTSDFKKKNGYQRSVELSKEYGMYRQDYCGCIFSKRQREQEKASRATEKNGRETD